MAYLAASAGSAAMTCAMGTLWDTKSSRANGFCCSGANIDVANQRAAMLPAILKEDTVKGILISFVL